MGKTNPLSVSDTDSMVAVGSAPFPGSLVAPDVTEEAVSGEPAGTTTTPSPLLPALSALLPQAVARTASEIKKRVVARWRRSFLRVAVDRFRIRGRSVAGNRQ